MIALATLDIKSDEINLILIFANTRYMIDKFQKVGDKGFGVIEILIVSAVIIIALTSLLGVVAYSLKISTSIKETTQANFLAQEAMEATRNFRDGTNWSTNGLGSLSVGVNYYPQKSADIPPKWTLVQGQETSNGFVRRVILEKVSRDINDDIEQTYNTANDDPNTRKIRVNISWQDKEIELVTYLTNWQ